MNLIVEIGMAFDMAISAGWRAIGLQAICVVCGAAAGAKMKPPASGGGERLTELGERCIGGFGASRIARVGLALDRSDRTLFTVPISVLIGTLIGGACSAGRRRCFGALVTAWCGSLWVWVHGSIASLECGPVTGSGAAGS